MNIKVKEIEDKLEKESVSREVLFDLPEWFGMPESTEEYIQDSQEKPFLACYMNDELVGFVVLNATSKDCADIFVMGIKKMLCNPPAKNENGDMYKIYNIKNGSLIYFLTLLIFHKLL